MKRVLITAGAAGLGRVMAEAFQDRGDRVAVCDIDAQAVADFAKDNPDALAQVVNVADETGMGRFLDHVEQAFGGIDVVCANAGTGGPAGRIETLEVDDWRACIDVNLTGAFLTCRWAARIMRAQKSGQIILTSSTAGLFGYPLRAPYAAAKWAIIGLTKTLAMELGPDGIRVNAICPGAVQGDRMDRVIAMESAASGQSETEVRAQYVKGVSMRSWVTAEEVADTVLWLASPGAGKICGQVISIDGHTETLAP